MPSFYDYIGKLRKCDHTTQVVHIPLCPVSVHIWLCTVFDFLNFLSRRSCWLSP